MAARKLVVGLGSPHGDDRIGWEIGSALRDCLPAEVCVRIAELPITLLDWLPDFEACHVIDGCALQSQVGLLHRWQWPTVDFALFDVRISTHGLSLAETLQLAERLQILPKDVTIWGVEIGSATPAGELCAELGEQVSVLSARIAEGVVHPQYSRWEE